MPGIFFNDPLSDQTGAPCFHDGKPCQCNLGVSSYGWFIMFLCVFISTTACPYATYPLYYFSLSFLSVLMLTPQSAESLPSCLQLLRALWRPNPCLSFYFPICLCFTMPPPVPIGTLWLQTSLILGLPLVERRSHYLVPGVWCGRDVSAPRFSIHPLPQNGNFDEKDEKNSVMTKKVLLSGSSYLEALGVDPSSPRTAPCSETNDPADPVLDTGLHQQS